MVIISTALTVKRLFVCRDEVLAEVFHAPKRRVDNEISRLSTAIETLLIHCKVSNDLHQQAVDLMLQYWKGIGYAMGAALAVGSSIGLGMHQLTAAIADSPKSLRLDRSLTFGVIAAGVTCAVLCVREHKRWSVLSTELSTVQAAQRSFEKLYARELALSDKHVTSLWSTTFQHHVLTSGVLTNSAEQSCNPREKWKVTNPDKLNVLSNMLQYDVARLQRKATAVSQQDASNAEPTQGNNKLHRAASLAAASFVGAKAAVKPSKSISSTN